MNFRSLIFGRADPVARTVPVTVSTEEPVDRGDYIEVLDHSSGAVDLSRAPLPLIEQHDNSRLNIGIVENLRATNGKLSGIARFGTSQRAEEIFQDVINRVVRSVSVGYLLTNNGTLQGDGRTRRFSWMPYEVSCVSCPADIQAGFFRTHQEHDSMYPSNITSEQQTLTRSQRIASKNISEQARERAADIDAVAKQFEKFGVRDLADDAIRSGASVDDFTRALMDHINNAGTSWTPEIGQRGIGMSPREVKQYSICRAIEAQLTGDWRQAGLEREVHETLARGITHRNVTGILIPTADIGKKMARDLLTSSPTAGGNLVGTDHRPDLFIDALRESSAVLSLGAQYITGLQGNVDIPTLAGDVTPVWQATEATLINESQPVFGQVLLSPKSCAAYTELSRRLLKQSAPAAENLVVHSMMKTIGFAIDQATIQGSGTGGQPAGLLIKAGIGAVTGTSINWDAILDFEADVSNAHSDMTSRYCGFVTTYDVRKLLKGRLKVAGYPEYLWQSPDNRMNGYAAMATSACPSGTLIFGNWSEVIVAEFGPIEIVVNPYAQFQSGIVGVRAIADIDIAIKHAGSFSVATSVT